MRVALEGCLEARVGRSVHLRQPRRQWAIHQRPPHQRAHVAVRQRGNIVDVQGGSDRECHGLLPLGLLGTLNCSQRARAFAHTAGNECATSMPSGAVCSHFWYLTGSPCTIATTSALSGCWIQLRTPAQL